MRALIQRVDEAKVHVVEDGEKRLAGSCKKGFLILLGACDADDENTAKRLWDKVFKLRVFADDAGKTNLSLADVGGEVLVVSQFTLYADCRKGNRPSFTNAGSPEHADALYRHFCELAEKDVPHVGRGVFGAEMKIELVNDGPFTVWLDTDDLSRRK